MKYVPCAETDEAKKKSYQRFIYEPMMEIHGDDEKNLLELRPDPSLALHFSDRQKLQTDEYTFEPEGVYTTKNSGVIVSACIDVPDITKEMLNWFMIWHQIDPLRYAIWDPEDHYNVTLTDEDRARYLNDDIPLVERIWGTTSSVLESMNGEKPEKIDIDFYQPSKLGYDDSLIGTDYCQSMVCSYSMNRLGPIGIPVTMTEILRKGPNGTNVWVSHWWIGCGVENGKDIIKPIPGIVARKVAHLLVHNHKEITHLNKILPKLYKEYGSLPLTSE